jgi:hypothetical protein
MGMVSAAPTVSHRDIIDRAGGPAATSRAISLIEEAASRPAIDANTVKAWKRADSIPGAYWQAFRDADLATLNELASAAAARRGRVAA